MLLAGFVLTLVSFFSYFLLFSQFPVTRDFPWVNLPLSAAGVWLLGMGLWRAYTEPEKHRGRIYGPLLALPALAATGLLFLYIFHLSYQLPEAAGAPKVGDTMPNIALLDQSGEPFELAQLIPAIGEPSGGKKASDTETSPAEPPWVLLVFYRGYW